MKVSIDVELSVPGVEAQLKRIADLLSVHFGPPSLKNFSVHQFGEEQSAMTRIFKYEGAWAALVDPDGADHIDLTVTVDGVDSVQTLGTDAVSAEFEAPLGSTLACKLEAVDAAGNRSAQPASFGPVVVADEVPPEDPSGFALKQVSEREG